VFGRKSSAAGGSITGVRKSGGVTKVDTVVVGSGISGATAAYYLHSKGINVLLTEAKDEVGGNLISKKGSYFCSREKYDTSISSRTPTTHSQEKIIAQKTNLLLVFTAQSHSILYCETSQQQFTL
jgi:monoamine oxidase